MIRRPLPRDVGTGPYGNRFDALTTPRSSGSVRAMALNGSRSVRRPNVPLGTGAETARSPGEWGRIRGLHEGTLDPR